MSDNIRNRLVVDSCRTYLSITQNSVWICLFFGDTEHFNKLVRDYINEIPSTIKKFRRNREINKILE